VVCDRIFAGQVLGGIGAIWSQWCSGRLLGIIRLVFGVGGHAERSLSSA
jgi:hypothetical protein